MRLLRVAVVCTKSGWIGVKSVCEYFSNSSFSALSSLSSLLSSLLSPLLSPLSSPLASYPTQPKQP